MAKIVGASDAQCRPQVALSIHIERVRGAAPSLHAVFAALPLIGHHPLERARLGGEALRVRRYVAPARKLTLWRHDFPPHTKRAVRCGATHASG
eukprot:scaffold81783_cov74-Phaeocystis_antarctica.AAC.4